MSFLVSHLSKNLLPIDSRYWKSTRVAYTLNFVQLLPQAPSTILQQLK